MGTTPHIAESTIACADVRKPLECSWGGRALRWELEPVGGGTRLTLWHHIDPRLITKGAAGWHICFDVLDRLLGGAPLGRIVATTKGHARGRAQFASYPLTVQAPFAILTLPG